MKILLNSDSVAHDSESVVELCQVNKNSYTGLINLRLPLVGGTANDQAARVNTKISITADSSVNAKGRSRILFKASIPYSAFVQTDGGAPNNYEVDPKRSGGEVAVHTVISVPKALRDDILGRNGSVGQNVSAAQLTLVGQLVTAFTKLIQPIGSTSSTINAARDRICYDVTRDEFCITGPGTGKVPVTGFGCIDDGDIVAGQQVAQYYGEKIEADDGFEYQLYLGRLTSSPIMRALNGLAPICDDQKYRTANLRSAEPTA